MNNSCNLTFMQNRGDSPCRVDALSYGRKGLPLLRLSKWDEEAFLHFETGGRGETVLSHKMGKNFLSITGSRRKHVFKRIDDKRIEFDIILREMPEKPEIEVPMSFPEGLEFFKQGVRTPELIRNENIRGSYAVYWKERNNKYKTGKFCHIYRPKIIDSCGRWIWGELEYDGKALFIKADEKWLKTARYPVIFDPIVGTDSVGASNIDPGDEGYLLYEMVMPVNRYILPGSLSGLCTAYYYSYRSDTDARGYPVLYGQSGGGPDGKISSSEEFADFRNPSSPGEWLSAEFNVSQTIPSGSAVWFGFMPRYMFYPYYDESGIARNMDVESYSTPPSVFVNSWWQAYQITLSMYFSYTAAENYILELYSTGNVCENLKRIQEGVKKLTSTESAASTVKGNRGFLTFLFELIGISDITERREGSKRNVCDSGNLSDVTERIKGIGRKIESAVSLFCIFKDAFKIKTRKMLENVEAFDLWGKTVFWKKEVTDNPVILDYNCRIQDVKRKYSDSSCFTDVLKRGIIFFFRITALSDAWDYIFNRKAKSKDELLLLSRITIEIDIKSVI